MDLNFGITVPYQRAFFSDLRKKIIIQRGGTRSTKTHSTLQMLTNWLFTGDIRHGQKISSGVATVVRKVGASLKGSVIRDMENIMKKKGIYRLVKHHKTDRTFTYKDRMIEFIGADDEHKIRGPSRQILFCNEGDSLQYKKEFFQLMIRTTDLVIIDFNPSDPYTWINLELEQKRARERRDVLVIVSTYKDNPTLSKGQIEEIEYLEEVDDDLWLVYGLGQYGNVKGLIYPKATIIEEMPYQLMDVGGFGMDLGFGSSPTTMVECGANKRKDLFLDEIFFQREMLTDDIHRQMLFNDIRGDDMIICDSSDPRVIRELQQKGWLIQGVQKFPDSVKYGINLMKSYKWHITGRSENIIRERMLYKWQEDRDGNPLPVPIKAFDHTMDAIRYWGLFALGASRKTRRGRGRRTGQRLW